MEYITKKDLIDCSTPDEFCFSLCCMECKTVWKSTPIRFSKAGKKPENENRKIIYDTLYDREKNLAFQKALNQAKEIFNICPICKRLVCDHCFLICDGRYPKNSFGIVDEGRMKKETANLFRQLGITANLTQPMKKMSVSCVQFSRFCVQVLSLSGLSSSVFTSR